MFPVHHTPFATIRHRAAVTRATKVFHQRNAERGGKNSAPVVPISHPLCEQTTRRGAISFSYILRTRVSCAESIACCADENLASKEKQRRLKGFHTDAHIITSGLNMTEKDMLKALLNKKQAELVKLDHSESPPPLLSALASYPDHEVRGRGRPSRNLPHPLLNIWR